MENKRYDKQLRAMLTILEDDYAGSALAKEPVDSVIIFNPPVWRGSRARSTR